MAKIYDVIIIGGGIGGLGCLHYLKKKNVEVLLLEKNADCGGLVRSYCEQGHLLEIGPNAFLKSYQNTYDFICDIGLKDEIITNRPEAYHRYIYRHGIIHALPENLKSFIKTRLLSTQAKLRLFFEPFVSRGPNEESIESFGKRRFGSEVTHVILDAMVKGICTGDISKLDINSMFPRLKVIEKKYRSLLLFLLFFKKRNVQITKDGKKTLFLSLKKGMGQIATHLQDLYSQDIILACQVNNLKKSNAFVELSTDRGQYCARKIILATQSMQATQLLYPCFPEYAKILERIPYADVITVTMSWPKDAMLHPLDGFGFLVSSRENLPILGALFSSSLFLERAPEDEKMVKVYLGGAHNRDIFKQSDQTIIAMVEKTLTPILKLKGKYSFVKIRRIENAIPLYNLGHQQILQSLQKESYRQKNLFLVGNYTTGISVDATLKNAKDVSGLIV